MHLNRLNTISLVLAVGWFVAVCDGASRGTSSPHRSTPSSAITTTLSDEENEQLSGDHNPTLSVGASHLEPPPSSSVESTMGQHGSMINQEASEVSSSSSLPKDQRKAKRYNVIKSRPSKSKRPPVEAASFSAPVMLNNNNAASSSSSSSSTTVSTVHLSGSRSETSDSHSLGSELETTQNMGIASWLDVMPPDGLLIRLVFEDPIMHIYNEFAEAIGFVKMYLHTKDLRNTVERVLQPNDSNRIRDIILLFQREVSAVIRRLGKASYARFFLQNYLQQTNALIWLASVKRITNVVFTNALSKVRENFASYYQRLASYARWPLRIGDGSLNELDYPNFAIGSIIKTLSSDRETIIKFGDRVGVTAWLSFYLILLNMDCQAVFARFYVENPDLKDYVGNMLRVSRSAIENMAAYTADVELIRTTFLKQADGFINFLGGVVQKLPPKTKKAEASGSTPEPQTLSPGLDGPSSSSSGHVPFTQAGPSPLPKPNPKPRQLKRNDAMLNIREFCNPTSGGAITSSSSPCPPLPVPSSSNNNNNNNNQPSSESLPHLPSPSISSSQDNLSSPTTSSPPRGENQGPPHSPSHAHM